MTLLVLSEIKLKYCIYQLEPEEEAAEAAVREVLEEAGVRGQLGTCLGVFEVATKIQLMFIICFNILIFSYRIMSVSIALLFIL